MRVAVTGTPGTGKTTATESLQTDLEVIHLNQVVEDHGFIEDTDDRRDSWIADLDAVEDWVGDRDDVIIESHLAHHVPCDIVVVLRCHPEELARRLHQRGEPSAKVEENAEAEALDVILAEAVGAHGEARVYEMETTDRDPAETAREIEEVIAGDREPEIGTVSYLNYLA